GLIITQALGNLIPEKNLKQNKDAYKHLLNMSAYGKLICRKGKIILANKAFISIIKAKKQSDVIGIPVEVLIETKSRKGFKKILEKIENNPKEKIHNTEAKFICINGKTIEVEVSAYSIKYEHSRAVQMVVNDITDRKMTEEKLKYLAYHDALTKLPNRFG